MNRKPWLLFSGAFLTVSVVAQSISNYQGFFIEEWSPKHFEPFATSQVHERVEAEPTVWVLVDSEQALARIPRTVFGYNLPYYINNGPSTHARRYYRALPGAVWRFPGGTPADCYFWDAECEHSLPDWYVEGSIRETNWRGVNVEVTPLHAKSGGVHLEHLYQLLEENPDMQVVLQVNYSASKYANNSQGSREDRLQLAAEYAAEWVRDVNIERGLAVKYWEVGNEIGCDWTPTGRNTDGSQHTVDGREYGEDFLTFAAHMKAVDPTIKVGASGDSNHDFTAQCLRVPGFVEACDFLSVHDYYGPWGQAHSDELILSQASNGTDETLTKYRRIFENAGFPRDVMPIVLSEYHTASVGNFAKVSQLGAIFFAKAMGTIMEGGYGMSNMFAISDVWRENGDLGLLAEYAQDFGFETGSPYVPFFVFHYYHRMFGDQLLSVQSSNPGISVFASLYTGSGHLACVVINETDSKEFVEIRDKANERSRYSLFELKPSESSIRSLGVEINGIGPESGRGGPTDYESIEPFAGVSEGGIRFAVEPFSIYFVVVADDDRGGNP